MLKRDPKPRFVHTFKLLSNWCVDLKGNWCELQKSHFGLKRLQPLRTVFPSSKLTKMKTSTYVSLFALLLCIAFDIVLSSGAGDCEAFWRGVTPLFPDGGGEAPKAVKGKKAVARQEPSETKPRIPLLDQALRWQSPNEMVLYVETDKNPLAQGTCPCKKEGAASGQSTVTLSVPA